MEPCLPAALRAWSLLLLPPALSAALMALPAFASCPPRPEEGLRCVEYEATARLPRQTDAAREVAYFFRYDCGHCQASAALIAGWRRNLPERVAFKAMYATWEDAPALRGRGELATVHHGLEALGATDPLPVFAVVSRGPEGPARFAAIAQAVGSNAEALASAITAPGYGDRFARANQTTADYRIESVPALVVNGRYRIEITSSDASAVQRALALARDLLMEDADAARTPTAEAQPPVRKAQVIAFEERIVGALKAQDYSVALELADEYRERNYPLRAEFLFLEQHAAREAGHDARAYSVMREFLRTIPREHPLYPRVESLHQARKAEADVQLAQFNAARKERLQGEAARRTHALTNSAAILEAVARDMVTIPGGEFRMGDVNGTGDTDELPVRSVRVPSFQMSRYEVTFELYDLYCMATEGELPDDEGHGGPRHPVFNVDFTQMLAFIRWLNRQTGGNYRLPTEAEWEYAARAGSTADYPSGDEYLPGHANGERTGGADGWEKTAPVGSFPANAYGLHDMSGNVMERVQDCFNRSYAGAPVDGSAWMRGECQFRVSRGADWLSGGRSMRIARRNFHQPEFGSAIIGFRLARDLP